MNKKVCLYCRSAQDDQTKLDLQIENLKSFAKQKGLEAVKIISEIGSGMDLEREGLSEIIEVAKSKEIDMILMRDVSQISRNTVHCLKFVENIEKYVEFKTVESFDIPQNEWNGMISVLSEFYTAYKNQTAC